MNAFSPLTRQQFINLETIRKSGVGVKTPVWFALDGEQMYVRTIENSGKVKRIRNNGRVNVAPCKADGTLLGDWIPAVARQVKDEETGQKIDRLLDKKYGLMKKMFAAASALQGKKYTVLEISR
jgi:uncharacterized protein